jgi:hypothetical protein
MFGNNVESRLIPIDTALEIHLFKSNSIEI